MRRDNIELVKEQLRAKSRELSKRDNEKARHDAKIKHVLELSKQKISDLKIVVAEKEEMILTAQAAAPAVATLGFSQKDSGEGEEGESSVQFKEPADQDEPRVVEKIVEKIVEKKIVETREIHVRDPKLVKALKTLKLKYQAISDRVENHKFEKEQLSKERGILTKEVQRLRKEPDKLNWLKSKVEQMDERSKQTQARYEKLLKEKNDLIQSYEQTLFQSEGGKTDTSKLPSEIIKELKEDLGNLSTERDKLNDELLMEKKRFDSKLSEELQKVEEEMEKKSKKMGANKLKQVKSSEQMLEEGEAPIWMTTYADMVTLMLTFFILMYSIAAVNMQKMMEAILGEESASIGLLELLSSAELKESIQSLTGMKSDDILSDITEVAEDQPLDVDTSKSKVVVRIPGNSLFPAGKANLQKGGLPMLDEVIRVISKYPNYVIHIQGHTDDVPIHSDMFPTNWELSAARATAVLRYFIDKGVKPERLTATGYADTFPLATNNTELGRSKNRRVEFVLEKEK